MNWTSNKALFSSSNSGESKDDSALVIIGTNDDGTVATLTLNRPPVNSLNLELNLAISQGLRDVAAEHPEARALVLRSSNPEVLSAGLDLDVLHEPASRGTLGVFWRSFQRVFLDLWSSPLATVAAIEGHAPAGGCLLATACDHRVMASDADATIGLSETRLGVAVPYWMCDVLSRTVGDRVAERSTALGISYAAPDALRIGLVDETAPRREVLPRALAEARRWAAVPPAARHATKMSTRGPLARELERRSEEDVDHFCDFVLRDETQRALGAYLESLKQRRKR